MIKEIMKYGNAELTYKNKADKYNASKILINVTGGEPLVRQDLFE